MTIPNVRLPRVHEGLGISMAGLRTNILAGLNPAQRDAVTSQLDVVQILAPPGSGKTKTLTSRVAYLLEDRHYKPWNIICLTFTIKSAREMKDRISKLLGNGTEKKLVLGTFHSVCRRYLVSYGHLIGISKDFGIADSSDTLSIIKRMIKRYKLNLDPRKAQGRISQTKSKGLKLDDIHNQAGPKKNVDQQEFITIYEEYEKQLAASNLLDYDDLLARCVDLLRDHPQCVSNVEAVLIDEFQDTNVVQFELMTLFADKHKRVTTVGDMDQSIYGWRSAEIKNLQRMQKRFPDTLVINLQENYRSSGSILLCANEVIEQDTSRPQKGMMPTHRLGTAPVLRRIPSAEIEAAWIVSELKRCRALTGDLLTCSDFAILLRSASLSRLIESALGRAGIPYRMVGGHRFYDRVEVKILLDYLRVISQPSNNDAIARTINTPTRGIGEATAKLLLEDAEMTSTTVWTSLCDVVQGYKPNIKVSKSANTGIGSFRNIVMNCRSGLSRAEDPSTPEDLLRSVIKKLDFKAYLEKLYPDDFETRWLNVEELVSQAADFGIASQDEEGLTGEDNLPTIDGVTQGRANAAEEALSRFLANVALTTEIQQENEKNANEAGSAPQRQVTISTIHAAKGLEWPVVFVPSACDGCIPHSRAEDTDEERRLLYVAMTRAQALLYMSCPMKNSHREEATLSPFIAERKVSRMLAKQGPSIDANTVHDIASILSRELPTELDVIETSQGLASREDDNWSLDGSENVEVTQARLARFAQNDSGRWKKGLKRGRSEETPVVAPQVSTMGFTTTMQGFVTASEHLQTMPPIIEAQPEETQRRQPQQKKAKSNDKPSVAADLHNFFAPRSKASTVTKDLDPRRNEVNGSTGRSATQHALSVSDRLSAKPQPQPRVQDVYHVIQPMSREPLLPIPQSLSSHRVRSGAIGSQPFARSIDEASNSNGYLFLSSSPPPTESLTVSAAEQENASELNKEQESTRGPQAPVNVKLGAHRKTLGTKRSLGGWSSTGQSSFAPPKLLHRQS